MDGRDLRELQESDAVPNAFSALVSGGKLGYKTIIQKDKKKPVCQGCNKYLSGDEKFCPECGTKVEIKE
ncbi:hypothetical protein CO038_01845 [Candidatus Pacearchaeota archaeon CG_4_9_14_0_2_um_filter_39_13]|nr:hypothetical protein [Candidatus Pacearchaeota archaeon]OIO43123.1 MAG: hypothetical protein AUJ64_03000 [Candidatus Pacearchaeota archaeon CG1_02_39_14]PJC44690.1 MAG: hypothetical protein CO038_01845 [Candidatus Pacearchaeota archaeon CG_4_9_14_0_2_um_filter_39_13]